MAREEASKVVPAVYSAGLKPSGLPSEQYTKVFPLAGRAHTRLSTAAQTKVQGFIVFFIPSALLFLKLVCMHKQAPREEFKARVNDCSRQMAAVPRTNVCTQQKY
jgi:hypothetical protein